MLPSSDEEDYAFSYYSAIKYFFGFLKMLEEELLSLSFNGYFTNGLSD
jgi:hypothetical protein